jgi:hypothetical protein
MNFMNNVANVDYDNLDAIVMWHKLMVEFFKKSGFLKTQLLKLLGDVAGETVVHMGTNPSENVCMFISYPMDRHDEPGH